MEKEEEEEGVFMDLLDSGGLLLEMEGEEEAYPLCPPCSLSSSSSSATNSSTATQMLYFGADGVSQKSSDSSLSTLPSSPSSISTTTTTTTTTTTCKTSRKVESGGRVGGRGGGGRRTTAAATTNSLSKKHRKEASASLGTIKVRKEMLGERITALQQLVSPFSKSDTASVLHEALGYIRFLHDQVQVLSSPYLQRLPSTAFLQEEEGEASRLSDLRSRGLCLVPVSCTEYVGNDTGADIWSPAMGSNVYPEH